MENLYPPLSLVIKRIEIRRCINHLRLFCDKFIIKQVSVTKI